MQVQQQEELRHPNVKVIVSTWIDEDANYIEKIQELGATIVLNEKPIDREFHVICSIFYFTIVGISKRIT